MIVWNLFILNFHSICSIFYHSHMLPVFFFKKKYLTFQWPSATCYYLRHCCQYCIIGKEWPETCWLLFKNIKNFIKKLVHFGPHPHYVKLLANPWFSYFGCLELSTQHVSIKSCYQCLWESNQRERRVLWSNMNFALTSSQVNLFFVWEKHMANHQKNGKRIAHGPINK